MWFLKRTAQQRGHKLLRQDEVSHLRLLTANSSDTAEGSYLSDIKGRRYLLSRQHGEEQRQDGTHKSKGRSDLSKGIYVFRKIK